MREAAGPALITADGRLIPVSAPATVEELSLVAGEAHVWGVALPHEGELDDCRAVLCGAERARAEHFMFPRDRRRFIASHAALRWVLGAYARTPAAALRFTIGPRGKPGLADAPGLMFNLSHSGGMALVAVARDVPVGVDVEQVRPMDDAAGVVERFFSPHEIAAFKGTAPSLQMEAFFTAWTRKEAYVKALGVGLGMALDSFCVNTAPDAAVVSPGGEQWTLRHLRLSDGYVGAVAAPAPGLRIRGGMLDLARCAEGGAR